MDPGPPNPETSPHRTGHRNNPLEDGESDPCSRHRVLMCRDRGMTECLDLCHYTSASSNDKKSCASRSRHDRCQTGTTMQASSTKHMLNLPSWSNHHEPSVLLYVKLSNLDSHARLLKPHACQFRGWPIGDPMPARGSSYDPRVFRIAEPDQDGTHEALPSGRFRLSGESLRLPPAQPDPRDPRSAGPWAEGLRAGRVLLSL